MLNINKHLSKDSHYADQFELTQLLVNNAHSPVLFAPKPNSSLALINLMTTQQ